MPALANNKSENVFIEMIQKVFNSDIGLPFAVGGIFLCGILAAIMSTADSQLLNCLIGIGGYLPLMYCT